MIEKYLNMNETRRLLGIDDAVQQFVGCSQRVQDSCTPPSSVILAGSSDHASVTKHFDLLQPNPFYISNLLSREIDVLIYVGTYDWICNWVGNMRWIEQFEWEGAAGYAATPMGTWEVDGEKAGITKTYGGFTFATVDRAGHMVCLSDSASYLLNNTRRSRTISPCNRWRC